MTESKTVELGFAEEVSLEDIPLSCKIIPCKIGGKPSWLELEHIPSNDALICGECNEPCKFLCQVYAPIEDRPDCFHRTLFVFICKNESCCKSNSAKNILVFRSQLPQENIYYPADISILNEYDVDEKYLKKYIQTPENYNIRLCAVCGCRGPHICSRCKAVSYCSKLHQKLDWTNRHKKECGQNGKSNESLNTFLFPKFELSLESEEEEKIKDIQVEDENDVDDTDNVVSDLKDNQTNKNKIKELEELFLKNKNKNLNLKTEELEQYAMSENDPTFEYFRKRTELYPDQVLRYDKLGSPLWITWKNKLDINAIPNCEYCNSRRVFEFQLMPQLLFKIKEESLDWGVVVIYVCEKSCNSDIKYLNEFVYKQDLVKDQVKVEIE